MEQLTQLERASAQRERRHDETEAELRAQLKQYQQPKTPRETFYEYIVSELRTVPDLQWADCRAELTQLVHRYTTQSVPATPMGPPAGNRRVRRGQRVGTFCFASMFLVKNVRKCNYWIVFHEKA